MQLNLDLNGRDILLAVGLFLVVGNFDSISAQVRKWSEQPQEVRTTSEAGVRSVTVRANVNGNFFVRGVAGDVPAQFLVDTGASYVGIGVDLAEKLGLKLDGKKQCGVMADGRELCGALAKLATLQVGGIVMHDVDVVVAKTKRTDAILGMSFLSRLSRIEYRRDGTQLTMTE